jgi:hypothetical protein
MVACHCQQRFKNTPLTVASFFYNFIKKKEDHASESDALTQVKIFLFCCTQFKTEIGKKMKMPVEVTFF